MSIVRDTIQADLKQLMEKALVLDAKRKQSKTSYAKEYYTKKLAKNNDLLYKYAEALNRLPSKPIEEPNDVVEQIPVIPLKNVTIGSPEILPITTPSSQQLNTHES